MINEQAIIEYYNSGKSIAQIAQIGLASEPTIAKILRRNNIKIRKSGHKLNLDDVEIIKLYNDNFSTYQIADKLGCSYQTILTRLKKLGISRRSYTETNNLRSPEINEKISKSCKVKWQDQEYIAKVRAGMSTDEYHRKLSDASKKNWDSNLGRWLKSDVAHGALSKAAKETWTDDEYRKKQLLDIKYRIGAASKAAHIAMQDPQKRKAWLEKISAASSKSMKERWQNDEFRSKMACVRSQQPMVSSIQLMLYSILDDLSIEHYRERPNGPTDSKCVIGPYTFDCAIPRNGKPTLLIECQGDYWHSLEKHIRTDQAKATYINTYFKDQYVLIATCVFSPLVRQNVSIPTELCEEQVRELSRLCIHPRYQKKNFASWFISQCIVILPDQYRMVISYSDATFNHNGSIYRACNFKCDHEIHADYWYVGIDGWVMSKRKLYGHAVKLSMSESQFAEKFNYKRIYGGKKTRFSYMRH